MEKNTNDVACLQGFRILYQKALPFTIAPVSPALAAWSPQLDLTAIVATNGNLLLYRMNGQRVWGVAHNFGKDVSTEQLRWRPDGKMIAVGYTDGTTRIHDVNNGRVIHRISSEILNFGQVTCLTWDDNHTHSANTYQSISLRSSECTPQSLFDLDIGSMLPRLSALPSSAGPESAFTSKTTLDALINSVTKGGEGSHLDILLIGERSGKILLNVFDSFLIGTLDMPTLCHQLRSETMPIGCVPTSDLSTHALLLAEDVTHSTNRYYFSTVDLLFIQQFGQYLFQLASTSTRVQALIRYLREAITSIEAEFKTMNDLAQRYVGILNEDAEKISSTVTLELFEFLVTGTPSEILKEWLVDTVTERGQKRWEKSSTTGYETLRRLVHESLLPTCERLQVLFCRLKGLARWKESGSPLGLEPDDFARCLEVVSSLTLYSHEFLLKVNNELDLFKGFMAWLRHGLDQLITVINIDEKQNEDPQIDTLKVTEYIECFVRQSSLQSFFGRNAEPKLSSFKERGENITEIYMDTGKFSVIPGFMELAEYLESLCETVFSKPQQSMREQVRMGVPILLTPYFIHNRDMKMVYIDEKPVACIAFHHNHGFGSALHFARFHLDIDGGLSSVSKVTFASVSIPKDFEVTDVKFIDDKLAIVILHNEDTSDSKMVSINHASLKYHDGYQRAEMDIASSNSSSDSSVFSYYVEFNDHFSTQDMEPVSERIFDATWIPSRVVVNGNPDRRVGCVFSEDGTGYFVFDLDHPEADEDDDGEDGDSEYVEDGDDGEEDQVVAEESMEIDNNPISHEFR